MTLTAHVRRLATATALAASGTVALGASPALAAHVTGPGPWKATNTYQAQADLDGRSFPRANAVKEVNHVKKGQWIYISCQTIGDEIYGSKVWIRTKRGLFVPDKYVKTYTDGFLKGVPNCGQTEPTPTPASPPVTGPSRNELLAAANTVAFEQVGGKWYGVYKKQYPTQLNWGNDGCSVPEKAMKALDIDFPAGLNPVNAVKYYSGIFEKSCDRHDFGYRNYGSKAGGLVLGANKETRARIDARFQSNANIQCDTYFDGGNDPVEYSKRKLCHKIANIYGFAVKAGGAKSFF